MLYSPHLSHISRPREHRFHVLRPEDLRRVRSQFNNLLSGNNKPSDLSKRPISHKQRQITCERTASKLQDCAPPKGLHPDQTACVITSYLSKLIQKQTTGCLCTNQELAFKSSPLNPRLIISPRSFAEEGSVPDQSPPEPRATSSPNGAVIHIQLPQSVFNADPSKHGKVKGKSNRVR